MARRLLPRMHVSAPTGRALAALGVLAIGGEAGTLRARAARAACLSAGIAPSVLAIALVQDALYGSPLRSGYGSLDTLSDMAHVRPNLGRYLRGEAVRSERVLTGVVSNSGE